MIFPFGVICIRFMEGYLLENPPFSIGNRSGVYALSPPEVENGCISNMIVSFHLGWSSNFHLFPLFPPSHSTTSTFSQMVCFFSGNFRKKFIYHTNLQLDHVEFVSTLPKWMDLHGFLQSKFATLQQIQPNLPDIAIIPGRWWENDVCCFPPQKKKVGKRLGLKGWRVTTPPQV